jgi:hypothetical protein
VWIVLIVLTVGMVSCAGLVGGGIWYASRQFKVKEVASADVDHEFARMRARFKDQKPILDARHGGDLAVASDRLEARAQAYSGPPPKNLCLLVWSEERPKAVQLCLPFWLLKMKSGGLKFDVPNGESRRLELSAKDLERAGPALLLDEDRPPSRLLVWTE